jgi:hypothetical protein
MAVTNVYATGANAQSFINQLGGASLTLGVASTPLLSEVETWLDQLAAEIDGILSANGYGTVPATGTNDVLMIGRYVAQKGAAMAYGAGFMFDETPDKIKQWETEWDTFLTRLIEKKIRLVDQSPRSKMGSVKPMRYIED